VSFDTVDKILMGFEFFKTSPHEVRRTVILNSKLKTFKC